MKTKWSTQKLIYADMLVAIVGALVSLEFPALTMPSFHKTDFSDVPSITILLLSGPASVAWVGIIKTVIKPITVDTNSMCVEEFANLIGIVLFVILMWVAYKRSGETHRAAIASLAASVPTRTLFACFCDASTTLPLYAAAMGLPLNRVIVTVATVNPAISDLTTFTFVVTILFNLIKLGLNCSMGCLLYIRPLTVYPAVRTA